eukprot:Gb_38386 [translate_table: standard]
MQAFSWAGNSLEKNPPENKSSGHKHKAFKSQTAKILQTSTSTLSFELQDNQVAGIANLSQLQVASVDTTLNISCKGQTLRPETEKGSKRKQSCYTPNESTISQVNANVLVLEDSLKKARPHDKVDTALSAEGSQTEILTNTSCGTITDAKIKPNNVKKRNAVALDLAVVDEKVRDSHAKGNLKSLTLPELKSFLSANKAKVGGKKEELIQRIISLLSN